MRRVRYELRAAAAAILPRERVASCGGQGMVASIHIQSVDGVAHPRGVETCGSVWACPVCAAKVCEHRRTDLDELLTRHEADGGTVYMAALTVPHGLYQQCGVLRASVAKAWQRTIAGRPWKRFCRAHGLVGYVRALEVTYGRNGWHPHLHVLLLADEGHTDDQVEIMGEYVFARWADTVERMDLGQCSPAAFDFQRAVRAKQAGDYVGKWGAADELTRLHTKKAGQGGASPWQLLARARDGDRIAAERFREYAEAFKGARQLTWSKGLRERYGLRAEETDEELAAADPVGQDVALEGIVAASIWHRLHERGLAVRVLEITEGRGWPAAERFIRDHVPRSMWSP